MISQIENWEGRKIDTVKSKGGKIALLDYRDNLVVPKTALWPHPDILKKISGSKRISAFRDDDRILLSEKIGFYCDLQSINSEDAITWSVFGTLHYFSTKQKVQFVNSLLKEMDEPLLVSDCELQLWMRIAHPQKPTSPGPELDFIIISDKAVIIGESKWTADIGQGQGLEGDKNQLEVRHMYRQKYGEKIFPGKSIYVLLLGLQEPQPELRDIEFVSWEKLIRNMEHPMKKELTNYYLWKKSKLNTG